MTICQQICKSLDYEGYLASLFYPNYYRNAIWALRSLNAECALNEKRILFYNIDLKQKSTPITQNLPLLNEYWLSRMMNSKKIHSYRTLEDLEEYCEASHSSLLYLSLEILGLKEIKIDHVISHIGKCIGLINTIRGIGPFLVKKKCYIPYELLSKHHTSQEALYRGTTTGLQDIVHELSSRAFQHKETALDHLNSIPKEAFLVVLHIIPSLYYITLLEQLQFDITNKDFYKKNQFLLFQLFKSNLLKRIPR